MIRNLSAVFCLILFSSVHAAQKSFYYFDGSDHDGRYVLEQNFIGSLEDKHEKLKEDPFFDSEGKAEYLQKNTQKIVLDPEDSERTQSFLVKRRESNKRIVIVVPPLKGKQERMAHIAALFPDCDILFPPCYFAQRGILKTCVPSWFDGAAHSAVTIPSSYAVRAHDWARKAYTEVVALGVCFGACLVADAQRQLQEREQAQSFDRIILDSMPSTYHDVVNNWVQDPTGVQSGGAQTSSDWWKWFASVSLVKGTASVISYYGLPEVSFLKSTQQLECPVLFIHGTDDASVTNEQFNQLYGSVPHFKKYALVTPHRHMRHCKNSPGLYYEFVQRFMDKPIDELGECGVGSLLTQGE
ncbi:dienelactone hydrolase family protein [Candidatus Babeliales bacterium]|nr:dienelactone hydrolase family protein [Candidatus Babeliales bacterium]